MARCQVGVVDTRQIWQRRLIDARGFSSVTADRGSLDTRLTAAEMLGCAAMDFQRNDLGFSRAN